MTIWIGLALLASALAILLFTSSRRRIQTPDLGTVSTQWLSEHRGYGSHSSER